MISKTSDNRSLYYEIQGNLHGAETVVFLNGLTQSTVSWAFFLPLFSNNYKIVLIDFIFQGNSDKTGNWRDFDQHANDVLQVLKQENIDKSTIVGLSYGSLVAQHFAVHYPEKLNKLVLLSTFAHKTPVFEVVEQSWWHSLEKGGYPLMLDTMLPFIFSEEYFNNPIIPLDILKSLRTEANQNAQAIFNLMRATKERKDYRQELKKIHTPTLIIQGEKDMLLPVYMAEEVHKNITNSKLSVIKNAGHTLNLEHVNDVCNQILSFLRN